MMKISSKTRYALRAVLELGETSDKGQRVYLKTIAKTEDISIKYLESIFNKLKKAGILESSKGVNGGYSLARDFSEISIYDIITAVDGELSITPCQDNCKDTCERMSTCNVTNYWTRLNKKMEELLSSTKLSDI